MINFTKLIPTLLAALLISADFSKAATTVISEGVANITSTLGDNIYRKRAIENALQNIAISTENAHHWERAIEDIIFPK